MGDKMPELPGNVELVAFENRGVVLYGLAADLDALPVVFADGSKFLAVDTGIWYLLAEGVWHTTGSEVEL